MALKKTNSTLELIKYLSIISMIIDHIGVIFLDGNELYKFIGRFALIGFAFILAYNYKYHTKNKFNYKMRLLTFAIISQIPFMIAFDTQYHINILFLLLMGLYAIDSIEVLKENWTYYIPLHNEKVIDLTVVNHIMATIILSMVFILSYLTTYFIFGIAIIILMYYYQDNKKLLFPLLVSIALVNFNLIYGLAALGSFALIYYVNYDTRITRLNKYIFYSFYPIHLITLWIIKIL